MKPKRHIEHYKPSLVESVKYFIEIWHRGYINLRKHRNDIKTSIKCSYIDAVKLYKNYRKPRPVVRIWEDR